MCFLLKELSGSHWACHVSGWASGVGKALQDPQQEMVPVHSRQGKERPDTLRGSRHGGRQKNLGNSRWIPQGVRDTIWCRKC